MKVFPKEQIHVILFEDLQKNVKNIYHTTLDFLELEKHDKEFFYVVNKRRYSRSRILTKIVHGIIYQSKLIQDAKAKLTKRQKLGIRKHIDRILFSKESNRQNNTEIRCKMQYAFKEEIEKLESLLHVDLSNWSIKK